MARPVSPKDEFWSKIATTQNTNVSSTNKNLEVVWRHFNKRFFPIYSVVLPPLNEKCLLERFGFHICILGSLDYYKAILEFRFGKEDFRLHIMYKFWHQFVLTEQDQFRMWKIIAKINERTPPAVNEGPDINKLADEADNLKNDNKRFYSLKKDKRFNSFQPTLSGEGYLRSTFKVMQFGKFDHVSFFKCLLDNLSNFEFGIFSNFVCAETGHELMYPDLPSTLSASQQCISPTPVTNMDKLLEIIRKKGGPKLASDVQFDILAERCENYSLDDLKELLRQASLSAFYELVIVKKLSRDDYSSLLQVYHRHFENGLKKMKIFVE